MQETTSTDRNIISVGEWVLYLFLFSIPIVNIIMLCIWAFGQEPNPTKKNFAKAYLIWIAIGIGIAVLMMTLMFGIFTQAMSGMEGM